jgi:hypothetical protein
MAHFWPKFARWLGDIEDTRVQEKNTYLREFLTWQALMAFLLKLGSRRQVRFELDSPEALENLNRLAGCRQEAIAHGDTLDHFLGHVPPDSMELLRLRMVQRLIRMKALDYARLMGHFLVVIDGTGQLHFHERHCEHCLTQTKDGKTTYYHHVLEAKLVTPDGLAISIGSEFIQNNNPKATKQDCELKAFARLAPRLKRDYPQLLMCLCLDAIYAKGQIFQTCQDYHWKYLITFKKGSLPALWREYRSLRRQCPANRKTAVGPKAIPQSFAWVQGLEHVDDRNRRHGVNAFQCLERTVKGRRRFAWLTNFDIDARNVATLANDGGRCRWKIENEGFNIQKNGGFNLEHAFSTQERQIKNWYVLLQIAHTILQLLERGSLLSQDCKRLFGSVRNVARRLAESIRNWMIPCEALDIIAAASIQIRLNSS